MPTFLQYLYVIGTFQGFLLSALLLFTPAVSHASRVLGIWCAFLAIGLMTVLVTQSEEIGSYGLLLGMTGFFPASYGALLYLYCRHSVFDDGFQSTDLLHFMPFLSCYILNVDLIFAPDLILQASTTSAESLSIRFLLASTIMYIQAFAYMGYTALFLWRYQRRAQNNYASFNPDIFDWLWIVQGFNLVIWSIKTASGFMSDNIILFVAGDLLIVVLIYGIGMAQWRNPKLFKIADLAQEDSLVSGSGGDPKLTGALDESTRVSLLQSVVHYMKA